jgi:small subunit ribosomal protein S7
MRGKRVEKRKLEPDKLYSNRLVHRLVNRLMDDGKKVVAEKIVYSAFEKIKEHGKEPVEIFETAMKNVAPRVEVRSRRVGGASYQIPIEVRGERKEALALRWLVMYANQRPSGEYKSMAEKLAAEIEDAASGAGAAIKKRDDTHRMAEANKAFAHFRW